MTAVRLIAVTQPTDPAYPTAEDLLVYTARVSSPHNQTPDAVEATGARLLRYCLTHGHWSVFEQADMTVEITTSRAISAQLLRHRSFTFQEFSQRYAAVVTTEVYAPRRQDIKDRQNSTDDLPESARRWFAYAQDRVHDTSAALYQEALDRGIAKECARFLLPMSTTTRLYMKGSVRSWIHYLEVRRAPSTQKEHRDIADAVWGVFREAFPVTAGVMEAGNGGDNGE